MKPHLARRLDALEALLGMVCIIAGVAVYSFAAAAIVAGVLFLGSAWLTGSRRN